MAKVKAEIEIQDGKLVLEGNQGTNLLLRVVTDDDEGAEVTLRPFQAEQLRQVLTFLT